MAKLALTITFETHEDYDRAVEESRLLRLKGEARTAADQLGEQVARHLGGLRYIEKGTIEVLVATVRSGYHSGQDKGESAVQTTLKLDVPTEKRRAG